MPLNIKNEETCSLANQIAQMTGQNLTSVVTIALKEHLSRLQSTDEALAKELLLIGKDCASRLQEPFLSTEHGALLYDDKGLPK